MKHSFPSALTLSAILTALSVFSLPVWSQTQETDSQYTFTSESLLDNQCIDTPPLGDGFGWDGICTCRTNLSNNSYAWGAVELVEGQLLATNNDAPGTCSGSGSVSIFDWRGDEPPVKIQELTSSVRSANDNFGLHENGYFAATNGIMAVRSGGSNPAAVTIFKRTGDQWFEDVVLNPVLLNRGGFGDNMIFLNDQQLLIDEDDALFIYNTSDWSISQQIPIIAYRIVSLDIVGDGFVLNRALTLDLGNSSITDYFVKEGSAYRKFQTFDNGYSSVSENTMISEALSPGNARGRTQTVTTRELDSSGLWVELPNATIEIEDYSNYDALFLVDDQLVLSTQEQEIVQIHSLGSSKTWELDQQINLEACDPRCFYSRIRQEDGKIVVSNYGDNSIEYTVYSRSNNGVWSEIKAINLADNEVSGSTRFSLIDNNYALAEVPIRSSNRATVGIYNINTNSSNSGSTPDSSINVAPTDMAGECDYSNAELSGGWGWNEATSESCAPLTDSGGTAQMPAGCDYSNAALYDGWGWNESTRESCAPLSESTEAVEQVMTQTPAGCDYSNAAMFNGWGWNDTTRESCAPLSETSEPTEQITTQAPAGCDYRDAALTNGWGWNESTRESCAPL